MKWWYLPKTKTYERTWVYNETRPVNDSVTAMGIAGPAVLIIPDCSGEGYFVSVNNNKVSVDTEPFLSLKEAKKRGEIAYWRAVLGEKP